MNRNIGIVLTLAFTLVMSGCANAPTATPASDGGVDTIPADDQQVADAVVMPDQMDPDFKTVPDQMSPDFKSTPDQIIPDQSVPDLKVVPTPTITAVLKSSAYSSIVVGGNMDIHSATYTVFNTSKSNPLNTFTIVNDLSGPFNKAEDTNVVCKTAVVCAPTKGKYTTFLGSFVAGKWTNQNMNCYDTMGKGLEVQIYFDACKITGGTFSLSGKKVRLGILNTSMKVTGQSGINSLVVRKAKPMFAKGTQSSSAMPNGSGELYKFTVTANGGDLSFARFVFKINTKKLGSVNSDIFNFTFHSYAGAVKGHHIWGQSVTGKPAAVYLKGSVYGSGLQDADTTNTTSVNDGAYYVVVTFDNELIVSMGSTQTFSIQAYIVGAVTDSTLVAGLMGDDTVNEVKVNPIYDNDNGFGNTSTVTGYTTTKQNGLFDGTMGTGDHGNEFFGDTVADWTKYRNIVWSDQSGGSYVSGASGSAMSSVHTYPKVKGSSSSGKGLIMGASGTLDWTNGYLLGVGNLTPFYFKK